MTREAKILGDEAWAEQLLAVVRARFGQEVPERRREALRRAAVEAYVASKEPSLETYVARLSGASLDSPCVSELVSRFTVKESYFFRDELTTFALRDVVLPRLLARAARSKELSIWSAGSANGEEPYTIAILLDALAHEAPGVRIRIVGTDLDEAALEVARRAEYGEWSVRTMPSSLRERYFERRGSRFSLRERHRRWVRFETHNLADPDAGPPEPGTFDLVLCRNVAIYFSEDALVTLYSKLAGATKPGGFVITAPSDPRPSPTSGIEPLILREGPHATVVYVREAPGSRVTPRGALAVAADDTKRNAPTIPCPPSSCGRCATASTLPPPSAARSLAAAQREEPAPQPPEPAVPTRDETKRAIAHTPLDAAPYFALALLEIELDDHDAAEAALKKALYLAPNLSEAHYRLGLLRLRRGDVGGARRSLWNALDALRAGDDDCPPWAASLGVCLAELERR